MQKSKILSSLCLAGGLGLMTTVASATQLDGLQAGGLYFNYYGIEQVNEYNNISNKSGGKEGNWGLIQVSSIYDAGVLNANQTLGTGSNMLWNNGAGNGQIIGLFYGINFTANSGYQVATGGHIDLYWLPHATSAFNVYDLSPNSRTAVDRFNGITNAADVRLLMSANFSTGSVAYTGGSSLPGWNTGTVYSTTDPVVSTGSASSYLSVNPAIGAWGGTMDNNWFLKNTNGETLTGTVSYKPPFGPSQDSGLSYAGGAQDAYTKNSYEILSDTSNWNDYANYTAGFDISSGSVTAHIATATPTVLFADSLIPEPGTIFVLGSGLAALATARRRVAVS